MEQLTSTKYKQTEVGLIPEDWTVAPLKEYLSENPKYGIGAAAVDFNSNYPTYLRITDIDEAGNLIKDGLKSVNHPESLNYILEKGEIVFARTGASVGKSYLYNKDDGELVYAGFLIKTKPDSLKLSAEYLSKYVTTGKYWNWVRVNSMRSGQPGINSQEYGLMPIPLPPTLTEQRAIATVLSDTDALLRALEEKIAKKKSIKKGVMQELLRPKEGWEVKTLGEIAEINMGQSPLSEYYNTGKIGLPLIQGNADIENRKTIKRVYTSVITKKGRKGDIIMSVRAPVGEVSKTDFDCCLGRGVCSISYVNDYLYHYLVFVEKQWSFYSTGSTFDSVNSTHVKSFDIHVPPTLEEQTRIAQTLSDLDQEIENLEQKLAKYQLAKQGLMQQLLTGKIRLV